MKTTCTIIVLLLVLISLQINYHTIEPYKRPPINAEHYWIKRMEDKYMKINKRIYEVCQKAHSNFGTTKKNSAGGGMKNYNQQFLKTFIIDEDNHLGYCGHPKVASTSTMHFFMS